MEDLVVQHDAMMDRFQVWMMETDHRYNLLLKNVEEKVARRLLDDTFLAKGRYLAQDSLDLLQKLVEGQRTREAASLIDCLISPSGLDLTHRYHLYPGAFQMVLEVLSKQVGLYGRLKAETRELMEPYLASSLKKGELKTVSEHLENLIHKLKLLERMVPDDDEYFENPVDPVSLIRLLKSVSAY